MADRTCSIDGCDRTYLARGFCSMHHQRWRRGQDLDPAPIRDHRGPDICTIDDCDRDVKARGWCSLHYERWYVHGDPHHVTRPTETCTLDGCDKPHKSRGYCNLHYRRWKRDGDPGPVGYLWNQNPPRICEIDDCDEEHQARGWCPRHYHSWRRHGDPVYVDDQERTREELFWEKVDVAGPDECWEWQAATSSGYGSFGIGYPENIAAHRYSWMLHSGEIPDGKIVRHTCDNRPCVNPAHLRLGTKADNFVDMMERGRGYVHKARDIEHDVKLLADTLEDVDYTGNCARLLSAFRARLEDITEYDLGEYLR